MNKIQEVLLEQTPEVQQQLTDLAKAARGDTTKDPIERMVAAATLADIAAPLMMESIRREFAMIEPKYEYRYVRGARTKVRVI